MLDPEQPPGSLGSRSAMLLVHRSYYPRNFYNQSFLSPHWDMCSSPKQNNHGERVELVVWSEKRKGKNIHIQ